MVFGLEHAERMDLARYLAGKLVEVYGGEIIFIGVYGSVARGEDKEFQTWKLSLLLRAIFQISFLSIRILLF